MQNSQQTLETSITQVTTIKTSNRKKKPSDLTLSDFSKAELAAGKEYFQRKNRKTNPPGTFDNAGRFFASERTYSVRACREPSRRWPYSEMQGARTADHCAELFDVDALAVKRVCKILERQLAS